MGSLFYTFLIVIIFSFSCLIFMKEVTRPIPIVNTTNYSKKALRLEKGYRVFSWGILTLLFFGAVVYSFYELLIQV